MPFRNRTNIYLRTAKSFLLATVLLSLAACRETSCVGQVIEPTFPKQLAQAIEPDPTPRVASLAEPAGDRVLPSPAKKPAFDQPRRAIVAQPIPRLPLKAVPLSPTASSVYRAPKASQAKERQTTVAEESPPVEYALSDSRASAPRQNERADFGDVRMFRAAPSVIATFSDEPRDQPDNRSTELTDSPFQQTSVPARSTTQIAIEPPALGAGAVDQTQSETRADTADEITLQNQRSNRVSTVQGERLTASIVGPGRLTRNQTGSFEISIANTSQAQVANVIVQLSVPEDVTITHLDRRAWLDHKRRTVSWKVGSIEPGQSARIPYSTISFSTGSPIQRIEVFQNDAAECDINFVTTISP